jgi:lipoprotein NlpI
VHIFWFQLYEECLVENERLRGKLKKTEGDLNERKSQLDKLSVAVSIYGFLCWHFSTF